MTFRLFTEYGAASRTQVTIRTNELLFISKTTLKQFDAEESNFAVIYIDELSLNVGIQFHKNEPNTNFRKISQEKSGVSINISPILKYLGIGSVRKKFMSDVENREGMLIFSIKCLKELQEKNHDSTDRGF